jgi:hypothetical protein
MYSVFSRYSLYKYSLNLCVDFGKTNVGGLSYISNRLFFFYQDFSETSCALLHIQLFSNSDKHFLGLLYKMHALGNRVTLSWSRQMHTGLFHYQEVMWVVTSMHLHGSCAQQWAGISHWTEKSSASHNITQNAGDQIGGGVLCMLQWTVWIKEFIFHTCNPSTWEVEAWGLFSLWLAQAT